MGDVFDQIAPAKATGDVFDQVAPSLPSMANMPGGPKSQPMDSGEGPVARTLTSFEAQTANTPANVLNYLKNLPQTFREDAAQHERVMSGKEPASSEFMSALNKVNPVAMNTPGQRNSGVDYGATGANLLPLALAAKAAPEGTMSQLGRAGLEVGKTGLRVADVATFNRLSQTANTIVGGARNIGEILNPPKPMTPAEAMSQMQAGAAQKMPGTPIDLPNPMKPTAAATVDPYRTQLMPKMQPGTSTTIEAHGYNPNTQEAVVHFKNGGVYKYKGVPQEVYNQFQNSESQGSFHANNLKGRYVTEKIGQVKPNRFSPGGKQ